jgi:VWFA-related protein
MKLTTLALALASVSLAGFAQTPAPAPTPEPRLLCMYLDLGSLNAAGLVNAREAAIRYAQEQMLPTDRVAVMTYTSQFNVLTDFTADRDKVVAALQMIQPPNTALPSDAGSRLQALRSAAKVLGTLPDKKTLLYFSTGVPKSPDVSREELQAATEALSRANIAVFPVDSAGLR